MDGLTRRSLIASAGIYSSLSLICGRRIGTELIERASAIPHDRFLHGCLFAAASGQPAPGDPSACEVDFWTFRVSEIDINNLPAYVGRIVVWDDVFSSRSLTGSVVAMLRAVKDWYGVDPWEGNCSFHVDGLGEINSHVRAVISKRRVPWSQRLAVIDVSSCGLSRIDWPDILPHLRISYDAVVGFSHLLGSKSPSCEAATENARIRNPLACCDLCFWTNDQMLGLNEEADCDSRSLPLNALLHDLLHSFSGSDSTLGFDKLVRGSMLEGRLRIAPKAVTLRT